MPVLILIFAALCWAQLFNVLRAFWASNEQYGYGWFVPFLAAGLLWRRWSDRPAPEVRGQESEVRSQKSEVTGQWSIFLFLVLLLPFRLLEAANPGWIVLLWIHAVLLLGISLDALRLWGGMPALRHYWFPLFFLLISVPWPSKVDGWVTQELQRGVARVTVEVVGLFNIPAVQHGSVLEVSNGSVGIDEACSGIRSLQTSIMVALLLGELYQLRLRKRAILLASGFLIALVANVGRTSFLTWSAAKQGLERIHAWHSPAGLAVVGVVMGGLWLLAWLFRENPMRPQPSTLNPEPPDLRPLTSDLRPSTPVDAQPSTLNSQHSTRFALILYCLWVPATEGLTRAWYYWPGKGLVAAVPWTVQWPTNQSGFVQTSLPKRTAETLRCTENTNVSWTDPYGNNWHWIFMYWPPGQNLDIYVGGHNPEICMSGGGSTFLRKAQPVAVESGGFSMRFNHRLFTQEHRLVHVFQGTWEPVVPPPGQRLFGDDTLKGRVRNVIERRLIRGGVTLEILVSGPTATEDAARLLKELMRQLVVEGQPAPAVPG